MKITSQEEYGLRCLVQIARRSAEGDSDRPVPISEIAKAEGISVEYAGKLLSQLRQAKLVTSARGKNGGYVLARPAAEISLLELVTALSGPIFEDESCERFSGVGAQCVHLGDCGMRPVWSALSGLIGGVLAAVTIAELSRSEHEVAASLHARLLERVRDLGTSSPATAGAISLPTPGALARPAAVAAPRA